MFVDVGHSFELFKARASMYASGSDVFHLEPPSPCISSYHSSSRRRKHEHENCKIADQLLGPLHVS